MQSDWLDLSFSEFREKTSSLLWNFSDEIRILHSMKSLVFIAVFSMSLIGCDKAKPAEVPSMPETAAPAAARADLVHTEWVAKVNGYEIVVADVDRQVLKLQRHRISNGQSWTPIERNLARERILSGLIEQVLLAQHFKVPFSTSNPEETEKTLRREIEKDLSVDEDELVHIFRTVTRREASEIQLRVEQAKSKTLVQTKPTRWSKSNWVASSQLSPDIRNELMQNGRSIRRVQQETHYYQVTEKRTVPSPEFEAVRPQLKALAMEKGLRQAREKLLTELKNSASIQLRPAEKAGR